MEMNLMKEMLVVKYAKVTGVIALYWFVSILMVFLNKALLGGKIHSEFDAPLFVTGFQCVVAVILSLFLSYLAKCFPNYVSFPQLGSLEVHKMKKIFPLTCLFVGMMTTNNLCLKYVGVAFYYVGRSLTTVFNVLLSYFVLGEKTSWNAVACCSIIITGFWMGVDQENKIVSDLSIVGVVFGVTASLFVSLNAIYTKKILPVVDGSIWELCYYNNAMAVVLFLPISLLCGEGNSALSIIAVGGLEYWTMLIGSGLCGYAVGFVTGLQIKVTSPLTHNISGTAKACFQTVLATWWFSEMRPFLWWISNATVMGGSVAYTRVQQLRMREKHYEARAISSDDVEGETAKA